MKEALKVLIETANEDRAVSILIGLGLACLAFYVTGVLQGVL